MSCLPVLLEIVQRFRVVESLFVDLVYPEKV